MGDVGSLALGGTLGVIAVIIKQEILLFFVGGIFVIEALSVILQVASFKVRGKRVFRMAPIHHHFEQLGWTEPGNREILDSGIGVRVARAYHVEVAVSMGY